MGEVNKGNTTGACSNKKQASILSFFKTQNNKIKKESSIKCNNDKSCEEKESKERAIGP